MYDPMTVAHEIKNPFSRGPYKSPLITIWHVDPEHDGSDDSCGWFTPPRSKELKDIAKSLAWSEARDPLLFALDAKKNNDPIQCERFVFGALMMVSRCMVNRGLLRRPLPVDLAQRWAAEMTYNRVDSFLGSFCFKSGYHSNTYSDEKPNSPEEDKYWREEQARGFYTAIIGMITRYYRPWYRHPRWHFWHWHIQIHPLQKLRRWLFTRCEVCGKSFHGSQPVVSGCWDQPKPRWFEWFRGERDCHHSECVVNYQAKALK